MKHILKGLILMVAVTICSPSLIYAFSPASITLQMIRTVKGTPEPEVPNPEEEGTRKPGKPFTCTFDSETGIEFIGQETPEFSLYEIYVTETECIYASGDEFDFIDTLFSLTTGTYQICLTTTDGCVYAGYVNQ